MDKKQRFYNLKEELTGKLEGMKGKKAIKDTVEIVLDNYGFRYSIKQESTYTAYYVALDDETGSGSTLFINYKSNGLFKSVETM